MPKVFISYSWEDESHKQWVKHLADELLKNGIDATLDQYDLALGDRLPLFMEKSISDSDYVLVICTPKYKEKSDNRKGGVGYEGHIISGELLSTGNERKFIPIMRKGTAVSAIPRCLSGKLGVNLVDGGDYENNFKDLITTIWGGKRKPALGEKPSFLNQPSTQGIKENEPLHILGIITDKVTVPKMDGTRGSALYKIPFKLSSRPSLLWTKLFVQAWNSPPRFTTMHRPGIASVIGDEIILNGTTIEEVRDYHRDTLKMCVEIANKKEQEIVEAELKEKEREARFRQAHYDTVSKIADDLEF